jgi:hypothetical protein
MGAPFLALPWRDKWGLLDPPNFRHVTRVPPPVEPFSKRRLYRKLHTMEAESNARKDSLKVEKFSLLLLTLCVVVLVYVLVAHPF